MSNQQLDAAVRDIKPTLRQQHTYETERAQLVYELLGEVATYVRSLPTVSTTEQARMAQILPAAKPSMLLTLPTQLSALVASVGPALQSASTTEAERKQFMYDLLRAVYDHVKNDVNFPTEDGPERQRFADIGNLIDRS